MEKSNKDYKKKILICEKLGAKRFQKVVFKVEDIKYKVIKAIIPNFPKYYDKICDYKRDKQLKKLHSDITKKKVIDHYRMQKILLRKELVREQNRNYHIDKSKPSEFIKYLEWNKNIHKNGLKKDAILSAILIIGIATGITSVIPLLVMVFGSALINFQCVNIQNYNIYRFKSKEKTIKKLEEKQQKQDIEKYSAAAHVIDKTFSKTKNVPTLEEIVENIDSIEQLEQLRALLLETQNNNKIIRESKNKIHK